METTMQSIRSMPFPQSAQYLKKEIVREDDYPQATAIAGSNIAFVKYWGNRDEKLRIPLNGSISMTLDTAFSTTSVEFRPDLQADELYLNGQYAGSTANNRISRHLDHIRGIADQSWFARVHSQNSFPTGAGIASSASGFAALTKAATSALGLNLSNQTLSSIARLGSGSASRSIDGGFVEWQAGSDHKTSFAMPLAAKNHWDLVDIIAIVSTRHKETSSTLGHPLALTSPFFQTRLETVPDTLQQVRQAIMTKDLEALGEVIEAEALSLHVTAMTSKPSVFYWLPGTINVMHAVRQWRQEGGPVGYFTMDAGPNVHIITERTGAAALVDKIRTIDGVADILVCGVGPNAIAVSKTENMNAIPV